MSLAIVLLMLLTGLAAIMAFGLFMFYAWLPLLYALFGFDVGLLLGRAFTGDVGTTPVVLGLANAFLFLVPHLAAAAKQRIPGRGAVGAIEPEK